MKKQIDVQKFDMIKERMTKCNKIFSALLNKDFIFTDENAYLVIQNVALPDLRYVYISLMESLGREDHEGYYYDGSDTHPFYVPRDPENFASNFSAENTKLQRALSSDLFFYAKEDWHNAAVSYVEMTMENTYSLYQQLVTNIPGKNIIPVFSEV